jgi:hypothetical protein
MGLGGTKVRCARSQGDCSGCRWGEEVINEISKRRSRWLSWRPGWIQWHTIGWELSRLGCIAKGEPGACVWYKKIESYIPLLRVRVPTPLPAPLRRPILVWPGPFVCCCCVMAITNVAGVVIWARCIRSLCTGVDRSTALDQGQWCSYVSWTRS